MAKSPMDNYEFEHLLSRIGQETDTYKAKVDILYWSKGSFSALQAAQLLYAFATPSDKMKVIEILELRLCTMTCSEARDVINAVSIHNDKLQVLSKLKRVLLDCETREGVENILSCFIYERDKLSALPAGGHQGYAALGGLYTQARPVLPHLYGSVQQQQMEVAGGGGIEIPVTAKVPERMSVKSHPSYLPLPGRSYGTDRGYTTSQHSGYKAVASSNILSHNPANCTLQHQGMPAPTGFVGIGAN